MSSYKNIKIEDLKPYENNARIHSQEQIEMIVNSLNEFGFINPVIVDENNMILAGHGRVEAAKLAGFKEVPCRVIEGLSEDQKKAYVHADNKLFDLGKWNYDLLHMEMESLDLDMKKFGYEEYITTKYEEDKPQGDIDEGGELDLENFDDSDFEYECPDCGFCFNEKGVK